MKYKIIDPDHGDHELDGEFFLHRADTGHNFPWVTGPQYKGDGVPLSQLCTVGESDGKIVYSPGINLDGLMKLNKRIYLRCPERYTL